jgi:isocitrate dehydrogenase (NAD+)
MAKTHQVTLIPGDGIGPEVTKACLRVLEATGVTIDWEEVPAGEGAFKAEGTVLPERAFASIRRTKVALKGPVGTPVGGGHRSVNVTLRQALDLYACLRPVRSLPGVKSRYGDVDLVIVRENTEGLYSGVEHVVVPGVTESIKIVTERCSTRIARFAFDHAVRRGRKKVTAVHKANIMKVSDGLFLDCARRVRAQYPQVEYEELIIDNCAMQLVLRPQRFDVLVMDNLYGDILSDLAAGLVGGLGVVPGANIGDAEAVFEPVHGTAPDIVGKGLANPTALIISAALMLDHLEEPEAAARVRRAVDHVLGEGKTVTGDLGGKAGTEEYTQALVAAVGRALAVASTRSPSGSRSASSSRSRARRRSSGRSPWARAGPPTWTSGSWPPRASSAGARSGSSSRPSPPATTRGRRTRRTRGSRWTPGTGPSSAPSSAAPWPGPRSSRSSCPPAGSPRARG